MYSRKDIRYSIYRCNRPGNHPDKYKKIYDWVIEQLPEKFVPQDFTKTWDILIARSGDLVFVSPERDIHYIQSTCAEAKVLAKHNMSFNGLDDRQLNIVSMVETAMLEGKQTWQNYSEAWRVTLDTETGQVSTQTINVPIGQTMITEAMIQASHMTDVNKLSDETKLRIADREAGVDANKSLDLTGDNNWQQMTPEQVAAIKQIMSKEG